MRLAGRSILRLYDVMIEFDVLTVVPGWADAAYIKKLPNNRGSLSVHARLKISNVHARRLWLHLQGMLAPPHNADCEHQLLDTVKQLGMVQLDSINNVVRAHHHILWSRHPAYREADYNCLLNPSPMVFEHFSHDAAILPLDIYPYWQRQRQRRSDTYQRGALGKQLAGAKEQQQILAQIAKNGPMCSRDFGDTFKQRADKSLHAWMRPPHKLALDFLWLKGDLCVSHRKGFIKYYDIAERVLPGRYTQARYSVAKQIDFLCQSAIQRLGFAGGSEIKRFYDACDLAEVKRWIAQQMSQLCQVEVEAFDGSTASMYATADIAALIDTLPQPCQRLRIVSPFDPVVRDRARLRQLFGMTYRIEIYTPAAQRKYGYYIYPIIEGDRVCARIDVRANRSTNQLVVAAWWLESGVRNSIGRKNRLLSELTRLARLANVNPPDKIPEPSKHP